MAVTSRQGLIDYALRALGEPVVEVNIDDSQLEDRLDEALEYWRQYQWDGVEKLYMKFVISASELHITTSTAASFQIADTVIGGTSGATALVSKETGRQSVGTTILVKNIVGTFVAGETITSASFGTTAVLAASIPYVLGSYDKRYIEVPDLVYGITRVIPFCSASSSKNMFDLQYQLRLNDLYDLTSTSIIYYKTVMSHLALLDMTLNGYPLYRFNRMQGKLYLDVNWESNIALGDFIVVECYRALDPAQNVKVWNERWLKLYTIALFKEQWGVNGKKFQGMVLPGGVSIDFQGMYDEAMSEIKELETELIGKSAPCEFFLG
ncbi:neck protein [uncultured Caudovirales phage]|uniref:Neck protein n=1 Tax=uncultured Caudovirales phage TaxID=2100421 RepID=A0A6J5PEK1_9CAUD|nr:neck protein [uncultured Caudovirales phage]CAB4170997.1 neck protein [uncultured Caudovirales phage]CAB4176290.1 neck protein [uncultured Caudovirales phage]CAB4223038.1 neck protein [uncultured Caudovirales phage]